MKRIVIHLDPPYFVLKLGFFPKFLLPGKFHSRTFLICQLLKLFIYFTYSLYILLTALFPVTPSHNPPPFLPPLLLWVGAPPIRHHPTLAHQIVVGIDAVSPSEARLKREKKILRGGSCQLSQKQFIVTRTEINTGLSFVRYVRVIWPGSTKVEAAHTPNPAVIIPNGPPWG